MKGTRRVRVQEPVVFHICKDSVDLIELLFPLLAEKTEKTIDLIGRIHFRVRGDEEEEGRRVAD